ncbi:MAG: site-specific integrase [Candidatus Acidiferrum sp.]
MKPKVVLLARIKTQDRYDFLPVQIKNGRPIEPDAATSYYLRYSQDGKRKVEAVGQDLQRAFVAYQNRELNHTRSRMGLASITELDAPSNPSRIRIASAVTTYLEELANAVRTGEKSSGTEMGYRKAVEDFRDNCGVEFLDQVTGDVLRKYKLHMFASIRKLPHGSKHNTVAKRFRALNTFFYKQGIKMIKSRDLRKDDPGLINYADVPREQKKQNTDKYSPDEIKAMLSVADVEEADVIHFYLRTGCRDGEVSHMQWKDIDWKNKQIFVREKPGLWKPKDKENRSIPVEDGVLLERLESRRKRQKPPNPFVFPNTLGEPDLHLIRHLHAVVKRLRAKGKDIDGTPTLHRFRRTYASMMIAHSDLQTVSALLGHADIETTSRYLARDDSKARIGTRTAFKDVD